MADFKYAPMFQLGADTTEYYKIPGSEKLVSEGNFEGHKILKVSPEAHQGTAYHQREEPEPLRHVLGLLHPLVL